MQHDEPNAIKHAALASYSVDFSAACDTPAEIIAEELGLDMATAQRVADWVAKREADVESAALASRLAAIVSMLLPKDGAAIEVMVGGLIAAAGIMRTTEHNNMEQIATMLRQRVQCPACKHQYSREITRAALSHWAVRWSDSLGLQNYRHHRDDETRKKCSESRKRVVTKQQ